MGELTVANYLAALQDDPWNRSAMQGLAEALASGDPSRLGDDPVRLLEFARRNHEIRGEHLAAAQLIELELPLVASDDEEFAAALWRELGRMRRDDLMDDAGARVAYENARALRPDDEDIQRSLAQIAQVEERWAEISRHFIEQADQATDPTLRTSLLVRAASILWQYKKKSKNKEVDRLFTEALETDPSSARAARLYELTLRARGKFAELGQVLNGVAERASGHDEQLGLFLGAARVCAQQLDDHERAAGCYERVLDLAPAHEEALGYLVAHFTEREEWEHLVALYEDALRARQLKPEAEQGIVLQIAMVHWRTLERPDRAEPYFARVRKSDPAHAVMLEFYRTRYSEPSDLPKLLAVLSDAQRRVTDEGDKARIALEMARVAQREQGASERAIDAYKLVLRHDPHHAEALTALKELYRRSGKWNALVELLRSELDALPDEDRARRLPLLKEMLVIYRDELKLEATVLSTYNTILQLDPGDREATEELARTYEKMGRYSELIPVLTRQAESEEDVEKKKALYLRVASLWLDQFSNYNQATGPLDQVLAIDPASREALARLREIYTKKRAWQKLAEVLAREEELAEEPQQKRALLLELASLAGERLHDYPQAIGLYKRLLALEPKSGFALDALEKLAERAKDWHTLGEVLEQRVGEIEEFSAKTKLLTRLGTLYSERMQNPQQAASAWKRVLELDPKNGRALRTLREAYLAANDFDSVEALYAEAGDWEGYVDVLGSAADRAAPAEQKKALSFRAAEIYEQRLKEPARAFRSYERVLAVEPDNQRAVRALLPIYERDDKWQRVAQLSEVLLAQHPQHDLEGRLELTLRLVDVYQSKLRDGERAFARASEAYALAPEVPDVLARLEGAAELASAHERLAGLYAARAETSEGVAALGLRRRVAKLASERLKRPEQAAAQLERVLEADPHDDEARIALERIYRAGGRADALRNLYTRRIAHARDDAQRAELLRERAKVEEELLSDPAAAIESYRALHALRVDDRGALAKLDRLLADQPAPLAEVLAARIELADEKKERTELSLRLARLQERDLGDVEGAVTSLARVLELDPAEARAIDQLEQIEQTRPALSLAIGRLLEPVYERTSKLDRLVRLLKRRLDESRTSEERRALKLRLAELEGTLGDPKSAYATLESAFLDNPQNTDLWDRITFIAEQAGALDELAIAFTTAIEMAQLDAHATGELSARTARIYAESLGQPERAEPFYKRVLAVDPLSDDAYEGLRELYTTRERWDELRALYQQRIEHTIDPPQRLELLLQMCFLYEEILDDVELAIRSYEAVLELDPAHATSRRALERLYVRGEHHAALVRLLETERSESTGKEAIELTHRIGDLYEHKLREPERAVDQYAEVLSLQPTHLRAQEALARLIAEPSQRQRVASLLEPVYAAQGAHVELAGVLEVQLEALRDPGARVALLMRLAALRERDLHDVEGAYATYVRAVEADPSDTPARAELARIAQRAHKLHDRVDVLERVVRSVDEPRLCAELLAELAELLDVRLNDRTRALDAYTRLIAIDPDDPELVVPAARALERLHTIESAHGPLAEALALQIAFEHDPAAKAKLLGRLAELSEKQLGDLPRAIEAYAEQLELSPGEVGPLLALERLYAARGDHPRLIGILQRRDALASDEHEARTLARRIGEIHERDLEDADSAIQAYHDVLTRFGNDRTTLQALARVYEASDRPVELLEILTAELELASDTDERASLRFRAAELQRTRTDAPEAALDAYRVVLEESPRHEGALAALRALVQGEGPQRIEAARVLVEHADAVSDHEQLIAMLEVVAQGDDQRERVEALRRASRVAETQLRDVQRAYALMARAVQVSVEDDELGDELDELDRLARVAGVFPAYVMLLTELAPEINDEELSLKVLMRAALVCRDQLAQPAEARTHFERVLSIRPDYQPALDALEVLHADARDHAGLLSVLVQKTELSADPKERTRLLLRQAKLAAEALDDVPRAIVAYERVLEEAPSPEVFAGLEPLYARARRFDDLALLLERQLELGSGDVLGIRFRLAELSRVERNDPDRALELYREVMERAPLHDGARAGLEALMQSPDYRARAAELLEPSYLRAQRWPELSVALEAQLGPDQSEERTKVLLGRLAQLHEVQLEDLEAALDTYARLFRVDPSDPHTLEALTRLARVLGKQQRLAEIYEGYLDEAGVHDDLAVRLSVLAAQIRDQQGHDLERATALYERAFRYDPSSLELAEGLEDLLTRREAYEPLRALYRERADVASNGERIILLRKLAAVLEVELRDVDGAIRVHREILESAPHDLESVGALDRLLAEAQRWSELSDHLRYQIDAVAGTQAELPLRIANARLHEQQLDDIEGALDIYAQIAALAPDHAEALAALERLAGRPELLARVADILEPLYERAGAWEKLVWITELRIQIESEPTGRAALHRRIAVLHEQRGRSKPRALEALRRALVCDPADDDARREVERLAAQLGDWDALVNALEAAAQATSESTLKASLLASIARTHDERRGDPRAAIKAYERLVQCDTDDVAAYEQLEALLTMVGDWSGLVALLKRKVERSYDPAERAQLWRRAGSVLDELMDDEPGAIEAYALALEEDEDDRISLAALDDLHQRTGDHAALAEVLRRRAELSDDVEERLDVNLRLGAVLADKLAQPRKAIDAYGRALDDDPTRVDAMVALGKLYTAESMWPELLENLRKQLDLTPEPSARIALLFALGQVHDEHLSEFDEAIESYREALELDRHHEASVRALMRIGEQASYRARVEEILEPLLRDNARWDDLATLLSRGVTSLNDGSLRQARLVQLAEIHERGRGDLAAAFDALSEALVQDADDPRLPDEIERLAGRLSTWDRAADVLAHRAAHAGDPEVARELRRRLARIVERELSDVPRAIEVYEQALSQGGDDPSMLLELDRLYTASERHEELADVLERRVAFASDAEATDLLLRIGQLRESRFGDARAALNAYRDVLDRTPGEARAVERLEGLLRERSLATEIVELLETAYRGGSDLRRVAGLYEARLALTDGAVERAQLLTELAALHEHELADPAKAAEVLRRAFEADPRDFALLDEIERVAIVAGRFEVLGGLVESAVQTDVIPSADRRDLWMRAAAWYGERLSDPSRAEQALRKAIALDPDYEPAHEALVALLRTAGRHRELVDALLAWAEREPDRGVAAERYTEAAVVAETAAGQPERAIDAYEKVLALDGGQLHALDALIRVYEASGKLGRVAQLYDRRIEAEPLAVNRVDLRHRAAALRADKLEDRDGAIRLQLANLDDEPGNLQALDTLARLYDDTERYEDLARTLARHLEVAGDVDTRTRIRVQIALVAEQQLGDRARAIEELREIVLEEPRHPEASAALERLLAAEGRHAELVEQLERRADLARDAGDGAAELSALLSAGEILEERLDDRTRAVATYERAVEREPGHLPALRALARLALMQGDAPRAAELLDRLMGRLSGAELVEAAYALAEIAERQLGSTDRAEAALRRALAAGVRERDTRDRLASLYERTGAFEPLAQLVAVEAEQTDDAVQKVALLRRASELYRDKLSDPVQAARLLERASAIVPDDRAVLVPLCELYIAAGRQSDAIPVLQKIIASYGGRRVKEISTYHRMLARAHRGLNQVDRALAELDAAYRVDLTNVGVLADLGLLAFEQGDLERAQKTFRGLLLQKLDRDAPVSKADVYYYLGDISHQQGDRPKAISMLERAIAEQASHERAKSLLASLRS
ncbi:MAG: tetratricopeptide repeat protein [Polyangiales bacterium]